MVFGSDTMCHEVAPARARRLFDRFTGIVLVGLGVRLAFESQ
jgi:hypothetical protein